MVNSAVTANTANVAWTESITLPANGYEYYVSTTNVSPTVATVATGMVGAGIISADLMGLNAATTYFVWVRSVCSGTDSSAWSSSTTFVTSCDVVTSFSQNFDASLNIPTCWSKVGTLGSANVQASSAATSAPNVLYIYGTSAAAQPVVAMPAVSNAGAGTHRLKFKARANFTVGGIIEVGYLTDGSDATTFVSLQSFTTTSNTVFDTFVANLGTDPGASQVLAFRHAGVPANSVLIDDVSWELNPTTIPSCASNLVATPNPTCGNFATLLTWNAVSGSDGYYLTIGTTSGGNDILDAQNVGSVTTYSYVGSFNTTYFYKVVPFNVNGSATGCTEQSFSTFTNGCFCTSLPTSNDGSGISNVQLGTIDFPNGDVTYADYSSTPVDSAPGQSTNLQVTFATGFTYDTNVWIDFNNNYTFEASELVISGISLAPNPSVLDLTFDMPADAALGLHRMRLGSADNGQVTPNACYSGAYGVTIDFSVNIVSTAGNTTFDSKNFTYYPNPVKDVLNLSYTKNISNVTVFNLLGQQIATKVVNANQSKIDMSNLAAGTYLVKVAADNQVKTIKVIKE